MRCLKPLDLATAQQPAKVLSDFENPLGSETNRIVRCAALHPAAPQAGCLAAQALANDFSALPEN